MNCATGNYLRKAMAACDAQNISPTAYLYDAKFDSNNLFGRVLNHSRPDFFGEFTDGEKIRITMIMQFEIIDNLIIAVTFNSYCYAIIGYAPESSLREVATGLNELLKAKRRRLGHSDE